MKRLGAKMGEARDAGPTGWSLPVFGTDETEHLGFDARVDVVGGFTNHSGNKLLRACLTPGEHFCRESHGRLFAYPARKQKQRCAGI